MGMNRNSTVLTVCGLLLLAVVLSAKQTYSMRSELSPAIMNTAVAAETLLAFGFVSVILAVYRKKFQRQKKPVSQERFEIVRPLRRLFVSVWS